MVGSGEIDVRVRSTNRVGPLPNNVLYSRDCEYTYSPQSQSSVICVEWKVAGDGVEVAGKWQVMGWRWQESGLYGLAPRGLADEIVEQN
ncbi:hypothetical protein J6590_013917 [Homalodisca vitripennis]|nr:hypothetical protein J6590_013917 [Homalodisca vitripennis]